MGTTPRARRRSTRSSRVFGYDGLYVVDGSAISANLGVNPSPDDHRARRARDEPIPAKPGGSAHAIEPAWEAARIADLRRRRAAGNDSLQDTASPPPPGP